MTKAFWEGIQLAIRAARFTPEADFSWNTH